MAGSRKTDLRENGHRRTDSRKRAAIPDRVGHGPVGLRCSHRSCNVTCTREPAMSDLDVEPRNRSATIAVVVAVIFLAVLGTGVGIVLGSQAKDDRDGQNVANNSSASASPSPTVTVTQTRSPDTGGGGNAGGTRTKTPTNTKSYRPTARDRCPQQTEEAAGTAMTVRLYIKTSRSEVWICEGGGKTVYQGHVLGSGFPSATSNSTLFVGSVHYEAGIYRADNGATSYFVSAERLRIEENGNETFNELAVDTYTG